MLLDLGFKTRYTGKLDATKRRGISFVLTGDKNSDKETASQVLSSIKEMIERVDCKTSNRLLHSIFSDNGKITIDFSV